MSVLIWYGGVVVVCVAAAVASLVNLWRLLADLRGAQLGAGERPDRRRPGILGQWKDLHLPSAGRAATTPAASLGALRRLRHGWIHPTLSALAVLDLLFGALCTGPFQRLLAGTSATPSLLQGVDARWTPLALSQWTVAGMVVASLALRLAQTWVHGQVVRSAGAVLDPLPAPSAVKLDEESIGAVVGRVKATLREILGIPYEERPTVYSLLTAQEHATSSAFSKRRDGFMDPPGPQPTGANGVGPSAAQVKQFENALITNSRTIQEAADRMQDARVAMEHAVQNAQGQLEPLQARLTAAEEMQAALELQRSDLERQLHAQEADIVGAQAKARAELAEELTRAAALQVEQLIRRLGGHPAEDDALPPEQRIALHAYLARMEGAGVENAAVRQKLAELGAQLGSDEPRPVDRAREALARRDIAAALASLVDQLDGKGQHARPIEVHAALWGLTDQAWKDDAAIGRLRADIEGCYAALGMTLLIPSVGEVFQVGQHHPVRQDRGVAGQPRNRVVRVILPGLARGEEIVEKAQVELS